MKHLELALRLGHSEVLEGSETTINGGWKGSEEITTGGYKTVPLLHTDRKIDETDTSSNVEDGK